jgi:hypothetical protein
VTRLLSVQSANGEHQQSSIKTIQAVRMTNDTRACAECHIPLQQKQQKRALTKIEGGVEGLYWDMRGL